MARASCRNQGLRQFTDTDTASTERLHAQSQFGLLPATAPTSGQLVRQEATLWEDLVALDALLRQIFCKFNLVGLALPLTKPIFLRLLEELLGPCHHIASTLPGKRSQVWFLVQEALCWGDPDLVSWVERAAG